VISLRSLWLINDYKYPEKMIHKEGIKIILITFMVLLLMNVLLMIFIPFSLLMKLIIISGSFILFLFFCFFFRNPRRRFTPDGHLILSPADGKVVAIQKTVESEYFGDERTRISIFMSVLNVHINWYPVSGKIVYYQYHPGKYIIASHPKASLKNERNTIVIDHPQAGKILIRQIAGIVARRIISNAHQDKTVNQGDELGFIRFGSRVDLFLPPEMRILVKPGDRVRGTQTPIANIEVNY